MIVIILITTILLFVLTISLGRYVVSHFEHVSQRLTRIEKALGAEDWVDSIREAPDVRDTLADELAHNGIVGRLERIEAALDPMARAKSDVKRVMRELDEDMEDEPLEDESDLALARDEARKIQELIENGDRPDRKDWESWIRTPFPWD
jgi:hypothetical protein